MPTPQAYHQLWQEHQELMRAVVRYLSAPPEVRKIDEDDLWYLVSDYEPTESEQGLIPIPEGYAEP